MVGCMADGGVCCIGAFSYPVLYERFSHAATVGVSFG